MSGLMRVMVPTTPRPDGRCRFMARRPCAPRSDAGFTLAEVLLAMAILGMIATLVWSSFGQMLGGRERATAIQEHYQNVRSAMNRMVREISMAFLTTHQSADKRTITFFKGEDESPVDRLTFTSLAGLRLYRNANTCDQVVIGYYGEPDVDDPSRINLMRRVKRRLNEAWDDDEEYVSYVMAENVESLELEYYDPIQKEWVDEWDTMTVEKANRLPTMVKITLTVLDPHGEPQKYVTKTQLFLLSPLNFGRI